MAIEKKKIVFNPLTGAFDVSLDVSDMADTADIVATYVPLSQKGAANGVAPLDAGGKISAAFLPNSVMELQGFWDASTNTPTLVDGTGNPGDVYEVSVAGTVNFGAGPIIFKVGDWAVYAADAKWHRSINSNEVVSVNGLTGAVTLTTTNINEGTNLYYTAARFNTAFAAKSTDDLSEGITNLYYTNARAKAAAVADSIADGVTDVAPSQNVVFDALVLKADASSLVNKADTNLGNLTGPTAVNQNLNADSFTLATNRQIGDLVPFNRIGALRYSNPGIVYTMTGDFTLGSNQITNVTGTLPTFQTAGYYSVYVAGVTTTHTISVYNSPTLLTMSANALASSVGATFYLVAPYLARSEDITVAGQQSGLFGMRSGNVTTGASGTVAMVSGNATGAGGVSGLVNMSSGSTTTGNSGSSSVRTGASSAGGNSGPVNSSTGSVTTGTSGSQSLFTGNATAAGGISGGIAVNTGTTTTGATGQIDIITGGSTSGTTGNLNLGTGNTSGTKGVINAFTLIDMNGNKIIGAQDPTTAQELATKNYVDNASNGVVNLITNGNANSAVASIFTPYADVIGPRPTIGAGGSPVVTTSITSTNPLSGTKSYLITKPASNTQGQGVSVLTSSLDIDYRAKSLKVSVSYIVNSGTFVAGSNSTDGDVIWYFYDITNSKLVEPSNIKMFSNSNTISDKFEAEVQFDYNCTAFRLIAHCASTSTLAYELKVDSLTVSPQNYVYGSAVTDWQSWTPTGSWTSNATYAGKKRRVGDTYEYDVLVSATGIPSPNVALQIVLLETIDTSKLSNISENYDLGIATITDAGINNYTGRVRYTGANTVVLYINNSSGTFVSTQAVDATSRITVNSGDLFHLKFSAPIVGLSTSTRVSDGYDGRVIDFVGYVSTNQALAASVTNLPLTVRKDSTGSWTGSTFVVPSAGDYLSAANLVYTTASTAELTVYKNGTAFRRIAAGTAHSIGQLSIGTATLEDLKVGDVISIRAQNFGVTVAADTIGFVSITKIQGPQTIAASESINCRYTNTAGTSIANAGDIVVPFATKDFDTHGSFVVDTFTAPIAGKYSVNASILFASALYAAGNIVYAVIYRNGVIHSYGPVTTISAVITGQFAGGVSDTVNCVAGDAITIRVANTRTGGATALYTNVGACYVSIDKI
jgi:hypothetical protein